MDDPKIETGVSHILTETQMQMCF